MNEVEKLARRMCQQRWQDPDAVFYLSDDTLQHRQWEIYAWDAREELRKRGYVGDRI